MWIMNIYRVRISLDVLALGEDEWDAQMTAEAHIKDEQEHVESSVKVATLTNTPSSWLTCTPYGRCSPELKDLTVAQWIAKSTDV